MNTKPTKWQDTEKVISAYTSNAKEVTDALQDLYSIYDENLYILVTLFGISILVKLVHQENAE